MKRNIAIVVLALVFSMNVGSGYTQRVDHRLYKIESSLCEKLEDRRGTEQMLEAERKMKSRPRFSFRT